jgi:hypothetical protein
VPDMVVYYVEEPAKVRAIVEVRVVAPFPDRVIVELL